jgi:glycerate 2-kinase
MHVLIAPTSYKGTIDAVAAAAALARGAARVGAEVRVLPLSDGGPGLLDALAFRGGVLEYATVSDPLGRPVSARVLRQADSAIVESAAACGLTRLAPGERDPERADSAGVGELLLAAARGARRVIVGLGGSATVDGGTGAGRALGWRFLDEAETPLPGGGGALRRLARIEPPAARPSLPEVIALADVRTPLLGPAGAARVFAPQKGADAAAVARLEEGLQRLAARLKSDLQLDLAAVPGAGAAGGLGAGLTAFAGAQLCAGSEWVLNAVGFEEALTGAALVLTGEGCYDEQTQLGKIVGEVIQRATRRGIPALVIAGRIEARLPDGVAGVAGADAPLNEADLERIAALEAARLLRL